MEFDWDYLEVSWSTEIRDLWICDLAWSFCQDWPGIWDTYRLESFSSQNRRDFIGNSMAENWVCLQCYKIEVNLVFSNAAN